MRLVLISDTHGWHGAMAPLPPGDGVIHAGDVSGRGTLTELAAFFTWFGGLPYRHRIVIAGNHDFALERQAAAAEALVPPGVTYLRDAGAMVDGLRVWGSPWQPWFHDWAFNLERGEPLAARWALIPADVNVLVTHGPPAGILDQVAGPVPRRVGCEELARRVAQLPDLRLHVFGHIHEAYGVVARGRTVWVNASVCDIRYRPVNRPVVVDL